MLALALPVEPGRAAARRVDANGYVQLVSDYRYRGLSLSRGRPALQGEIEAHRDGWFAAGWASLSGSGRAGSELDLAFGRRDRVAGFDLRVSARAQIYNNAGDPRSVELIAEAGRKIGPIRFDVELAYTPRQSGGGPDNVYFGGQAAAPIPGTAISLHVRGGIENGYFRRKRDWAAGVSAPVGPVTFAASVIGVSGTDVGNRHGDTSLLLSVGRSWW